MGDHPHSGHRERVYDRFECEGLGSFADHEVLELMLFYAIPRQDVNPLAHNLIDRFGSLAGALEAPRQELLKVRGMTRRAALLISMVLPLFRTYTARRARQSETLDTTTKAVEYARARFIAESREIFMMLSLDNKYRLIRSHEFAGGTPNAITVHPRSIVEAALLDNACRVVLTHNHPGGAREPSMQDRQYTAKVHAVLAALQIEVSDHIIVSDDGCYSFAREGDMDDIREHMANKVQ